MSSYCIIYPRLCSHVMKSLFKLRRFLSILFIGCSFLIGGNLGERRKETMDKVAAYCSNVSHAEPSIYTDIEKFIRKIAHRGPFDAEIFRTETRKYPASSSNIPKYKTENRSESSSQSNDWHWDSWLGRYDAKLKLKLFLARVQDIDEQKRTMIAKLRRDLFW